MAHHVVSPLEKARKDALRRIRKKVTGGFGEPKCTVCGKAFTEEELLAEDFVWAVGHGTSAAFHRECFAQEFPPPKSGRAAGGLAYA